MAGRVSVGRGFQPTGVNKLLNLTPSYYFFGVSFLSFGAGPSNVGFFIFRLAKLPKIIQTLLDDIKVGDDVGDDDEDDEERRIQRR